MMGRPTQEVLKERKNFVETVTECVTSPSKFSEIFLDHKLFEYNKKYVDSDGLLHIVGEIENNTSTPLNQIKISAILVDNNGNEVKNVVDGVENIA